LRKGLNQTLKFLAFFIVAVFLLWIAFRNVEYQKLVEGLKSAKYSWVLLSLLFASLAYISRARRWVLLVRALGYKPSLLNTFYSLMTGYLANLALPRIGEITRCVALGKKEKIPVDQLIGTVVIERAIDFLSLFSIMIILIIINGTEINEFLKASIFAPLQQKVFSIFGFTWIIWVIALAIFALAVYLVIRYRKNLRKIHLFAKIFDVIKGVINGMKTITSLERKWEFIFQTVFIWINYALMTWVVVFAIESTSHINFGDGIFLLVVGGLAMSAPVQSGLGAYHYFISRAIAFIAGVKIEDGLIFAFLTHESQMLFVIIIGAISFFMIFRKNHEEKIS
jgi:glycosyltransferase 2 family protein